jgi:methylmalonyl-CoA/ethylmalonyl-CoA epimerase
MKIDHLGIAVADLSAAVEAYEALGIPVEEVCEVPSERVRVAFLPAGEARLELLEPTAADSPIARFLRQRSGLHHVCFLVDDIEAALAAYKVKGIRLIDETPRPGAHGSRVAFLHPAAGAGVLLELKEKPRSEGR